MANQLGATLDVPALQKFLIAQYEFNRERRKTEAVNGGAEVNTEEILTNFLKAHTRTLSLPIPSRKGRGDRPITIICRRAWKRSGINVQWAIKDRVLRISRSSFKDYLKPRYSILVGIARLEGSLWDEVEIRHLGGAYALWYGWARACNVSTSAGRI